MKKWILFISAFLILAGAIGALLLGWYNRHEREEQLHSDRAESPLVVSLTTGATVHLFKAGEDLDSAKEVPGFDGARMWLPEANYFLKVNQSGKTSYYPVPVFGYRSGPDEDGSIKVTVRPYPVEFPPRLQPEIPEYIYIPSGSFLMGDTLNPSEPHYIWVGAFFISPFETSNLEFRAFLNDPAGYADPANWTKEGLNWKNAHPCTATALMKPGDADYQRFGLPDLPVANVKWFEANAYCKWLTRKPGGNKWLFSLPNDAEWEKAGRGPDGFYYGLGMHISDEQVKLYNWKKNPDAPVTVVGFQQPAGSYVPNRYGIYHMSGNAAEWLQSVNIPFNRLKPYTDDERNHDDTPGLRVVRGGSWYCASNALLALSYRDSFQPEHSSNERGFRTVARWLPFQK